MKLKRVTSLWKAILLVIALAIVGASLWYSNKLTNDLAEREKSEAENWAKAYQSIIQADENSDLSFELEMIRQNEHVPAILTDGNDSILTTRNVDASKGTEHLRKRLTEMKTHGKRLEFIISPEITHYIYFEESLFIQRLRFYPLVQLSIIAVFLTFTYVLFNTARVSEQNQLWVGMAKETAHQLGTPLSSLSAWLELLREKKNNEQDTIEVLDDIQRDISRLELVAERFSKIGSTPELKPEKIKPLLENSLEYIRKRSSAHVQLELKSPGDPLGNLNVPLFEWVIENLLKNALDAMSGKGKITIHVLEENEKIHIDVEDTGKGIPKSGFKTVFEPGFSTKKRGWGLGLALSKRIIEQYHKGKIFVKESLEGKGTTFRITIKKY